MKSFTHTRFLGVAVAGALGLVAVTALGPRAAHAADAKVINITQVPCQFLEPEATNHDYKTTKKADCVAINDKTGKMRVQDSKVLKLTPGKYIFRVTNKDVPYEVGFWLRTKGYDWRNPIDKLTKTSVSGGGLTEGKTKDYAVTLTPGDYVYSCPLNPTPNYKIVVSK